MFEYDDLYAHRSALVSHSLTVVKHGRSVRDSASTSSGSRTLVVEQSLKSPSPTHQRVAVKSPVDAAGRKRFLGDSRPILSKALDLESGRNGGHQGLGSCKRTGASLSSRIAAQHPNPSERKKRERTNAYADTQDDFRE